MVIHSAVLTIVCLCTTDARFYCFKMSASAAEARQPSRDLAQCETDLCRSALRQGGALATAWRVFGFPNLGKSSRGTARVNLAGQSCQCRTGAETKKNKNSFKENKPNQSLSPSRRHHRGWMTLTPLFYWHCPINFVVYMGLPSVVFIILALRRRTHDHKTAA